ncbi:MAG: hypothetical protein P1U83_05930 [Roseovarius sp.]|nr:hypothetical protein [Roseovarius sp.]
MGHECLLRLALTRGGLAVPFEAPARAGVPLVLEAAQFARLSRAPRAVISRLCAG